MAHLIEAGQVVLNRQPAWHGLGTVLQHDMDWHTVVETVPNLGSQVVTKPIFVDFKQVPGTVATVRESDGKILGIVGDRYSVHQTEEAFSLLRAMKVEGEVSFESAGIVRDGKTVWILARVPEDFTILGDKIRQYLLFSTSFDGSSNTQCAFTPLRVVCWNTLTAAIKAAQRLVKLRHSGISANKFKEAAKLLGLHANYMAHLNAEAELLAKIPFGEARFQGLVELLVPVPEDVTDRAATMAERKTALLWKALDQEDLANVRENGWGAYNAVADWLQHSPPGRETATWQEARFLQTVEGAPLLETARQYILASA